MKDRVYLIGVGPILGSLVAELEAKGKEVVLVESPADIPKEYLPPPRPKIEFTGWDNGPEKTGQEKRRERRAKQKKGKR